MIVNGSQEALDLTCRVVLNAGDDVWLEDPGYFGALGACGTVLTVPLGDLPGWLAA